VVISLFEVIKILGFHVRSPQHSTCSGCGWRDGFKLWSIPANTLNK
jgi:hypothetical protein